VAPARKPRRGLAVPAAVAALAVVTAGVGVLALSSQGDDDGGGGSDGGTATAPRAAAERPKEKKPKKNETPVVATPPATPEPAEPEAGASGSQLNAQGFDLLQAGRYAEAVPVLRAAVATWPEDSRDIEYAYALFNLGKALNRSGDPEAAIPYLVRRLTFSDQRNTVQAELDDARRRAGAP
jgi:tetratricopeptide (TPR) repeat protein